MFYENLLRYLVFDFRGLLDVLGEFRAKHLHLVSDLEIFKSN